MKQIAQNQPYQKHATTSAGPLQRLGRMTLPAALLVLAAGLAACSSTGSVASKSPFELRGATMTQTEGWTKTTNSDVPGSVLYLSPKIVVNASDIQRATAQKDAAGNAILLVQFTPEGSLRLNAGTRDLVGKQLAVVLDGKVMNVAMVQAPLSSNSMALTGFKSFDDAVQAAHLISTSK